MSRTLGFVGYALLLPLAAQETPQSCPPPPASEARAQVEALNERYIEAVRTSNAAWFDAHMSREVLVVLGSGRRIDKAEFLRVMRQEPSGYRSLTFRDATVRVFGATAQVDADAPWTRADGTSGVSRYIDTYAWITCRWQVISAQITWLPRVSGGT
jgi:hypothetical protein